MSGEAIQAPNETQVVAPPVAAESWPAAGTAPDGNDAARAADGRDETGGVEPEAERSPVLRRGLLHGAEAFLGSTALHLLALVALALFALPRTRPSTYAPLLVEFPAAAEDELLQVTLAADAAAAHSSAMSAASLLSGSVAGNSAAAGTEGPVTLDQRVLDAAASASELDVGGLASELPDFTRLIEETPDGALGDPRAVVDSYEQALDRITQEVLWMLSKGDVLLVWCFDQSESMKDDQREIRSRIDRVYADLGLRGAANSDTLTTAITSFGERFLVHTRRPTSDLDEIRQAIDGVPTDPSGVEMMCGAIQASVAGHLEYVRKGRRQMALVLVSDESGERVSNGEALEATIALAREASCRVYTLGREAVFGYPYAHMQWRHPFTGHVHWLPIDRGPETGFVQQLQTDGFRRRYDAHPSGFGPFEQARLARETGGVFFMLPSLESNLVRGEQRRYELEAMRAYRPDLRARADILADRDASQLRRVLWQIIHDLDPYDPRVAEVMEVRFQFSAQPDEFVRQVRQEQAKAQLYLAYLDEATRTLDALRYDREREPSPRWQANYDLMLAQTVAYTARTYEYGACLEQFVNHPKIVPLEKPGQIRLSRWDVRPSSVTVGEARTEPYMVRARELFRAVIDQHPGTPWAARAEQELDRGFGFELAEHYSYYGPRSSTPRSYPQIPIPKL
ncbi:MAG: hypothetical protein J5I93_22520 [Pirellulaceae bacterium]|nr:hypothetical protein [Pirellulaceae bacterium]